MKIEQLLFGYDNGHSLITGSTFINSNIDIDLISRLSDWSGFRLNSGTDSSYITAFPLKEYPYYAIIKSWYAQEMERPGSVWSHVLLIDLNNIELNFDFRDLLNLFARPTKNSYSQYTQTIEVNCEDLLKKDPKGSPIYTDFISFLLIYSSLINDKEPFGLRVENNAVELQRLLLTIMQYLPVHTLRRLSFSTGGESYRSYDHDKLITMQYIQHGNAISLLSPPWEGKIKEEEFNDGIKFLAKACLDDNFEITHMLRIFDDEILDNPKKIAAFGQLMAYLYDGIKGIKTDDTYDEILSILAMFFPLAEEGTLLKSNFLGERISSLFCTDSEFLYKIFTHESTISLPEKLNNVNSRLQRLIESNRKEYITLLLKLADANSVNNYGKKIMSEAFQVLNNDEINLLSQKHWKHFVSLIMFNPEYLMFGDWISLPTQKFRDILSCFCLQERRSFNRWEQLLIRIINDQCTVSPTLCRELINYASNASQYILDYINNPNSGYIDPKFINGVCRKEVNLLEWLKTTNYLSVKARKLVIENVNPESNLVKEYGPNIWNVFFNRRDGNRTIQEYIFIFKLSFLWKNIDGARMLKLSFYKIHEELKQNTDLIWDHISKYSAELPFWQEWDKCKKLRKGIAIYLRNIGIGMDYLINFTPDASLNKQLLDFWKND